MSVRGASDKGRIRLLDVLRGVAIFGMLGTNIWLFSAVGDSGPPVSRFLAFDARLVEAARTASVYEEA